MLLILSWNVFGGTPVGIIRLNQTLIKYFYYSWYFLTHTLIYHVFFSLHACLSSSCTVHQCITLVCGCSILPFFIYKLTDNCGGKNPYTYININRNIHAFCVLCPISIHPCMSFYTCVLLNYLVLCPFGKLPQIYPN